MSLILFVGAAALWLRFDFQPKTAVAEAAQARLAEDKAKLLVSAALSTEPVQVVALPEMLGGTAEKLKTQINLRNQMDRPIRLAGIRSLSCGCIQVEPKDLVLDGDSQGQLNLDIDLRGRKGVKRFVIEFPEAGGPAWRLEILLMLREVLRFSSERIYCGMQGPGLAAEIPFVVVGPTAEDLARIESVQVSHDMLHTEWRLAERTRTQLDGLLAQDGVIRVFSDSLPASELPTETKLEIAYLVRNQRCQQTVDLYWQLNSSPSQTLDKE